MRDFIAVISLQLISFLPWNIHQSPDKVLDMSTAPRVFTSYSHDNSAHKDWVLRLADRLVRNGVDVILDQWDIRLGGDLPSFMETGLTGADRVLAVCSSNYVEKANSSQGGVGYEKMILTGQLMRNQTSDKIIPVIRNNSRQHLVPTFLSTRRYTDFRSDDSFEPRYAELLREIHGQQVVARPALGPNPFTLEHPETEPRVSFSAARYVSPAASGLVTFDCSNNNGSYTVGSGDMLFETRWTGAGADSVWAYSDSPSIRSIALISGLGSISEIGDISMFDTSSRTRHPHLGEIVLWKNTAGYYLATKIEKVQGRRNEEISFTYVIATDKSANFALAVQK